VDVTYRRAVLDEAELTADGMAASYPAMPQDPVVLRDRWEPPRRGYEYRRFLANRDGRSIPFLGWVHGPWAKLPDRHCEVEDDNAENAPMLHVNEALGYVWRPGFVEHHKRVTNIVNG